MIVLPSAEETVLVAYRENGDIRNTCKIVFLSCIVVQCLMIKICIFVKLYAPIHLQISLIRCYLSA